MSYKLVPGVDQPDTTKNEYIKERKEIIDTVEKYLPDLVESLELINEGGTILTCQDSFAAGLHKDELILLAFTVKYLGFRGIGLTIVPGDEDEERLNEM